MLQKYNNILEVFQIQYLQLLTVRYHNIFILLLVVIYTYRNYWQIHQLNNIKLMVYVQKLQK